MKSSKKSIIDLILMDHEQLKQSMNLLLNLDANPIERLAEAALLLSSFKKHSLAEDKTLYADLENEDEFRREILEGKVEHQILDQKVKTILPKVLKATDLSDELFAELKVLSDLLKHHIKEEEEDLIPRMQKDLSKMYLMDLGTRYARFRKYESKTPQAVKAQGAKRVEMNSFTGEGQL